MNLSHDKLWHFVRFKNRRAISDINDCQHNPCQNNGIYTDGVNSYTCDYSGSGFTGNTSCQLAMQMALCWICASKVTDDISPFFPFTSCELMW